MNDLYLALAQGAPPPGADQSIWSSVSMFAIIFLIFYFLVIRPQQKQAKEHQKLLESLQKGEPVVTSGGLHGKVYEVGPKIVTLEIADKVRVRVNKDAIARRYTPEVEVVESKTS